MIKLIKSNSYRFFSVLLSSIMVWVTLPHAALAQVSLALPVPGTMVKTSVPFMPPMLKGVKVFPQNAFRFDFIINPGDQYLSQEELETTTQDLIKYFLAALTTPSEDMWVNLSPYEQDRIIPNRFGETLMGRDLLAQDYILKQIMSSLLYPEEELGRSFWKRIYEDAYNKLGLTDIPVNTFHKVWIVPQHAKVYEDDEAMMITSSKLDVLLEEDYILMQQQQADVSSSINKSTLSKDASSIATPLMRDIILPVLREEVNAGKHFASLRQIYHAMIMATWYKKKLRNSILNQVYVDQGKLQGINYQEDVDPEHIYQQYLDAFKKGVFNYIKEDVNPETLDIIPRQYFSGGTNFTAISLDSDSRDNAALASDENDSTASIEINPITNEKDEFAVMRAQIKNFLSGFENVADGDVKGFITLKYDLDSEKYLGIQLGGSAKRMKEKNIGIVRVAVTHDNKFFEDDRSSTWPTSILALIQQYNNNPWSNAELTVVDTDIPEGARASEYYTSQSQAETVTEPSTINDEILRPLNPGEREYAFDKEVGREFRIGDTTYRIIYHDYSSVEIRAYDQQGNELNNQGTLLEVGEEVIVGRDRERLPGEPARYSPPNDALNQKHARISVLPLGRRSTSDWVLRVEDLGSQFGTLVRNDEGVYENIGDNAIPFQGWETSVVDGVNDVTTVSLSSEKFIWISAGVSSFLVQYNATANVYEVMRYDRIDGDFVGGVPREIVRGGSLVIGSQEIGVDYTIANDIHLASQHVRLSINPEGEGEPILRIEHFDYRPEDISNIDYRTVVRTRDRLAGEALATDQIEREGFSSAPLIGEYDLSETNIQIQVQQYYFHMRLSEDRNNIRITQVDAQGKPVLGDPGFTLKAADDVLVVGRNRLDGAHYVPRNLREDFSRLQFQINVLDQGRIQVRHLSANEDLKTRARSFNESKEYSFSLEENRWIRVGSYAYLISVDPNAQRDIEMAKKLGEDPEFDIRVQRFNKINGEALDKPFAFTNTETLVMGSKPVNNEKDGTTYFPKDPQASSTDAEAAALADPLLFPNHVRLSIVGDENNFRLKVDDLSGDGTQVWESDAWQQLKRLQVESMPRRLKEELGTQLNMAGADEFTKEFAQFSFNNNELIVDDSALDNASRHVLRARPDFGVDVFSFNRATGRINGTPITVALNQAVQIGSSFQIKPMNRNGVQVVQVMDLGESIFGTFVDGQPIEDTQDRAAVSDLGGIDLNEALLNLETTGDSAIVVAPIDQDLLKNIMIEGFNADVIGIRPFEFNRFFTPSI